MVGTRPTVNWSLGPLTSAPSFRRYPRYRDRPHRRHVKSALEPRCRDHSFLTLLLVMVMFAPWRPPSPRDASRRCHDGRLEHERDRLSFGAPRATSPCVATFADCVHRSDHRVVGWSSPRCSSSRTPRSQRQAAITREFSNGDLAEMKDLNAIARRQLPSGVEVYEINGPFFLVSRIASRHPPAGETARCLHPTNAPRPGDRRYGTSCP